jgi:hypothetical protein
MFPVAADGLFLDWANGLQAVEKQKEKMHKNYEENRKKKLEEQKAAEQRERERRQRMKRGGQ